MGSKNHEVVPSTLISQISGLRTGGVNKALGELAKRNCRNSRSLQHVSFAHISTHDSFSGSKSTGRQVFVYCCEGVLVADEIDRRRIPLDVWWIRLPGNEDLRTKRHSLFCWQPDRYW